MIGIINCADFSRKDRCPVSMIRIAGITILERQIRIMRKLGIKEIVLIPYSDTDIIKKTVRKLPFRDINISVSPVNRTGLLQSYIFDRDPDEVFLYFDGCSIFDDRLPERFLDLKCERAAMVPEDMLLKDEKIRGVGVETENRKFRFAGIASVASRTFRSTDMNRHEDITRSIITQVINNSDSPILDISTLSTYNYDMRRDQSYMWLYIESREDNHQAKKELLDNAQKSVLDWPAWFIHQPIEKWIIYRICEWPVTPNQITILNILVAFTATYFFATGQFLPAMLLALATGIIDGLDGKQARVKMMMSKIGRLEEVADRVYEYSWYLALAYYFHSSGHGTVPYIIFAFMFVCHFVEIAVSAVFRHQKGVQLDDFGNLERNFRWIGSRRNTNIWTLIPFFTFGAYYAGYIFIAGYYGFTVLFKTWRSAVHLMNGSRRKETASEMREYGQQHKC